MPNRQNSTNESINRALDRIGSLYRNNELYTTSIFPEVIACNVAVRRIEPAAVCASDTTRFLKTTIAIIVKTNPIPKLTHTIGINLNEIAIQYNNPTLQKGIGTNKPKTHPITAVLTDIGITNPEYDKEPIANPKNIPVSPGNHLIL